MTKADTKFYLEKLHLTNAHLFKGNEFPVAFSLIGKPSHKDSLITFLRAKAQEGFFNELTSRNGAVVLRNLGYHDPETLTEIIEAIEVGSGDVFFEQTGSTAKRTQITQYLTTANEGSPSRTIYQHNEFSRFLKYPTRLFFVCTEFDAEGGETPLVHGGELFQTLQDEVPQFLDDLASKGLYMSQVWPNKTDNNTSWHDRFCFGKYLEKNDTLDSRKLKAEKVIQDTVSRHWEWDADNNDLIVHQHTKPIRVYKNSERSYPVFFNSIPTYYADIRNKSEGSQKTKSIEYDNGEVIPRDYLERTLKASIDLEYKHEWQEGDIVIVDNLQVSHGRSPWRNGKRKILVSMWDKAKKAEYRAWQQTLN